MLGAHKQKCPPNLWGAGCCRSLLRFCASFIVLLGTWLCPRSKDRQGDKASQASPSISTSDGNPSACPGVTLSLPGHCQVHVAASLLQVLPCELIWSAWAACGPSALGAVLPFEEAAAPSPGSRGPTVGRPTLLVTGLGLPDHTLRFQPSGRIPS